MLTKYKDVRPKKGIKSPLKNVFLPAAHSDFFLLRIKKGSRWVRGHTPLENFWKFTCCNRHFSTF